MEITKGESMSHFSGIVEMNLNTTDVNDYCRDIIQSEFGLNPKSVQFKVLALNNINV